MAKIFCTGTMPLKDLLATTKIKKNLQESTQCLEEMHLVMPIGPKMTLTLGVKEGATTTGSQQMQMNVDTSRLGCRTEP
jgi:hypothetical protein